MRRVRTVGLLLLVAFAGLATAADVTYLDERSTKCWECHVDDPKPPTPMRSVWNIVPPAAVAVPVEGVLEYTIAVQNGWYHDVRYLEPVMDITAAPSLKFYDGREPVDATFYGSITRPEPSVTPPQPPEILPRIEGVTDPAVGVVNVTVPAGATSLRLEMWTADTTFQPEVDWYIYREGAAEPTFGPFSAGPGERVVFTRDGAADFEGVGYGNWTLRAQAPPMTESGAPNPFGTTVPLSVAMSARFDASEETVSIQSRTLRLKPFETTLFAWDLQAVGAPGPDEYVRIEVRGTAFWEHQASSNAIDWENMTKAIEIGLVDDGAGKPMISPNSDLLIVVVPEGIGGASIITISEAIGYASALLLISSIWSGGVFGKASRRQLNAWFTTARRRVAFHNFLSYGLTAAALVHMVLFLWTAFTGGPYNWSLGVIWGGLGILAMFGLGVTGALQVQMIRRWDYVTWKWTHFALAMGAIAFTVLHMLLDGVHFSDVQEWLGWSDPLDFRPEAG